jgi:hypothetical protein
MSRHGVLYDWESEVEPEALARLREVAARLMDAGSGWLAAQRPGIRLSS